MEVFDRPVQLTFDNGKLFPTNAVLIGYIFLGLSVLITLTGGFILGPILLLISLFVCFTKQKVEIEPEKKLVYEYNCLLGEIKIGKPFSYDKHKFITVLPLIESARVYASTSNSTTISNNYSAVVIFKDRLKGKKQITKFDSRNEAEEVAKQLEQRLDLKYFDYDPKLVRDIMLGNISL